jgi:hypothetical protein
VARRSSSPGSAPMSSYGGETDNKIGCWSRQQLVDMDAKFVEAVQEALLRQGSGEREAARKPVGMAKKHARSRKRDRDRSNDGDFDNRIGNWPRQQLVAMDLRFTEVMREALRSQGPGEREASRSCEREALAAGEPAESCPLPL